MTWAAACASTRVTGAWRSPELPGSYRPQKVLVVGLVGRGNRPQLEAQMVHELSARGIPAVPSEQFLPDDTHPTRDQVLQVVQEHGFDAVLVTSYKGLKTSTSYVPGMGYADYIGAFGLPMYDPFYGPGRVETNESAIMEANLFDARGGGQKVWSVTTSTFEPSNAAKEIPKVVHAIVERMDRDLLS